jgi:gliding motility-associatede transport system auxiliary component
MSPKWRSISRRIFLAISILALLAGIGLYIVQRAWNLPVQISLAVAIVGLAVFVALDPEAIRKALTGRQARYGSNVFILTVAFLGILVVINYLAYKYPKQKDLTADQSNTLAKETQDVLKSLPGSVTAEAFYSTDPTVASSKETTKVLLDKYVYESAGKFQYKFIDPNKDPVAAQDAGFTKDGSVILFMGNSKQPVTSVSETEITGAMVRLMNPGTHVVYFLTGHGEFSIDGSGDQSYAMLKSALTSKNYTVSVLNLLSTNKIPADASVIVIAGPQKPLADSEVSLLEAYMKNGGSMVVMEEPTLVTQFGDSPDPLANYLAQTFGITLGNDIVVDLQAAQSIQQPFIAIANQYAQHAITQKMNGMTTLFPTARSITIDDSVGTDYTKTNLIMTTDQSWGETDIASVKNNTYKPDQGVDIFGPLTIAVAAQGQGNSRLVVFGDSDFALNAYYNDYGNGDMIVNSIDWAANVESIINLTPKNTVERYLVQPQSYTRGLILLGSLIILPGLVLVAGVGSWINRRRKG